MARLRDAAPHTDARSSLVQGEGFRDQVTTPPPIEYHDLHLRVLVLMYGVVLPQSPADSKQRAQTRAPNRRGPGAKSKPNFNARSPTPSKDVMFGVCFARAAPSKSNRQIPTCARNVQNVRCAAEIKRERHTRRTIRTRNVLVLMSFRRADARTGGDQRGDVQGAPLPAYACRRCCAVLACRMLISSVPSNDTACLYAMTCAGTDTRLSSNLYQRCPILT
eukprot:3937509-Rhodomonas_salina.1